MKNKTRQSASKPQALDGAMRLAIADHQAGRLNEAARRYRSILAIWPSDPDALHYLGVLLHQQGQSEAALPMIQRSLQYAPGYVDALNNLGNVFKELGRLGEAEASYRAAVVLRPDFVQAHNNLGVVLKAQKRVDEAIAMYRHCLTLEPEFASCWVNLGYALTANGERQAAMAAYRQAIAVAPLTLEGYSALGRGLVFDGRLDEALEVYRQWQVHDPANPEIAHLLASCNGAPVPPRANDGYVQKTFDGFASTFDEVLQTLEYQAPSLCGVLARQMLGSPAQVLDVLDAGCGTGLCAPYLLPFARALAGVDLSSKMLALAAKRNVYHQLHVAELTAWLAEHSASYDLIVSADTLCYFGQLEEVALAAAAALRPGGHLVFTLEKSIGPSEGTSQAYTLHTHGRYSHQERYARQVVAEAGLTMLALEHVVLRKEVGVPVGGLLIGAKR